MHTDTIFLAIKAFFFMFVVAMILVIIGTHLFSREFMTDLKRVVGRFKVYIDRNFKQ